MKAIPSTSDTPRDPVTRFRVIIELPQMRSTLSDLQRLKPGDRLITDQKLTPDAVRLQINGGLLGQGSFFQLDQHWAVRISQLGG